MHGLRPAALPHALCQDKSALSASESHARCLARRNHACGMRVARSSRTHPVDAARLKLATDSRLRGTVGSAPTPRKSMYLGRKFCDIEWPAGDRSSFFETAGTSSKRARMLFNSLDFIFMFLPVTLAAFAAAVRLRSSSVAVLVLLVASYVFYG
jgi:hypothetical protein